MEVEILQFATMTITSSYFSVPSECQQPHMFSDSLQDINTAALFVRAQLTPQSGDVETELAFLLDKARFPFMKLVNVPKLELQAVAQWTLHAARSNKNCAAQWKLPWTKCACVETVQLSFNEKNQILSILFYYKPYM